MENPVLQRFQSQIGKAVEYRSESLGSWLGGTLVAAAEGDFTLSFTVRKDMTNLVGIMHGGTASAIIDDVMGMTVYALGKEFVYVTVSLSVDFLDNAKEGETVFARARVIRNGRTLVNVECHITNGAGRILAKGTSNLVATQIKAWR